jgi:hypothetical protein
MEPLGRDVGGVAVACSPDLLINEATINNTSRIIYSSDGNNQQVPQMMMACPATPLLGVWEDLPGEVVSKVACYLGRSIGGLKAMYGTCR